MVKYINGKLTVIDENKFGKLINWGETKHNNTLDINNDVVQAVFIICNDKSKQKLFTKLRIFYWTSCDNMEQFEKVIMKRLSNGIRTIEELVS